MSSNKPKEGNAQKDFKKLVKWHCKSVFNKFCLTFLKAKNIKWEKIEVSKGKSSNPVKNLGIKTGTKQDEEAVKVSKQKIRAKVNNKKVEYPAARIQTRDNKETKDLRQETGVEQDDKIAAEPIIKANIKVLRLSGCAFFLAVRLFCFLIFLSLKSVIGQPLSIGWILRSGLSVISIKYNILFWK